MFAKFFLNMYVQKVDKSFGTPPQNPLRFNVKPLFVECF